MVNYNALFICHTVQVFATELLVFISAIQSGHIDLVLGHQVKNRQHYFVMTRPWAQNTKTIPVSECLNSVQELEAQ